MTAAFLIGFCTLGAPARAQFRILPAAADGMPVGPSLTAGAIIWSHGRSPNGEDSLSPTPRYVEALRHAGWDIFRLNRMRDADTLSTSTIVLAHAARSLRAAGYRRVVLAGHSFGAFLSLMAAGRTDAVDAVIATAPAAYGNATENPDIWRLNATRLYEVLGSVRNARVALFFFSQDSFDPGERGETSEAVLLWRGLPHLVIDRPAGLQSHWAEMSPVFVERFGPCLAAFASADLAQGELACDQLASKGPRLGSTAAAQHGTAPRAAVESVALPQGSGSSSAKGVRRK